jgi:hypothetical protein
MPMLASMTQRPQDRKRDTRIEVRLERHSDVAAREHLLDAAFGASRIAKSSERLRDGRVPARALAFVAMEGDPEALKGARGMIADYHPRQSRWYELMESVARSRAAIPRPA